MTHKIAIIKLEDRYSNYDDYERIITSITEWTEVSHDDFVVLQKAQSLYDFKVLEQPANTTEFVAKTVADYVAYANAQALEAAAEAVRRKAVSDAKKYKKELKDRECKLALLEKLKAELGE